MCGYKIKFDIAFFKQLYLKYHCPYDKIFHHKTIDTVSVLKFLVLQEKMPKYMESFDKLVAYYHNSVEGRHTALDDAKATAQLFTKLLDIK